MDIQEVKKMLDEKEVTVVDIRDENSYNERHIDNAQNVSDQNMEEFVKNSDKNKTLLCYCYHGFSSQSAVEYFKEQGFSEVFNLDGGFEAWRTEFPES